MRVLISGRRHDLYGVGPTLDRFLDAYIGPYDFSRNPVNGERHIFIDGSAKGVDTQAYRWANAKNFITIRHPAEWDRWIGKTAGHFRNTEMLQLWRPNWLVSFLTPDSSGTRNMLNQATNKDTRFRLALNILLVKYADDSGTKAPIEVQESLFDLPVKSMEWGEFIEAPF